jgi:hypothetical protein
MERIVKVQVLGKDGLWVTVATVGMPAEDAKSALKSAGLRKIATRRGMARRTTIRCVNGAVVGDTWTVPG